MEHHSGAEVSLFMRLDRPVPNTQGMAIWQDRAFVLFDTGVCGVYSLSTRKRAPLAVFPLASYNSGKPSREYLNHANHCQFSRIHYKGNPIPLMYVTTGTGTGVDEDGYYYRCAVENITESADDDGSVHYSSTLVQTITYSPEGLDDTRFEPACWGCPAFFVDSEDGALYIFSARYRTKRDCVPPGEKNAYIISRFSLPNPESGGLIRLTAADILDQFSVTSEVQFTQGGALENGMLYYTYGLPTHGYPLVIQVFDLKKKCLAAIQDGLEAAMGMEELECCDFFQGRLIANTNSGTLYDMGEGMSKLICPGQEQFI